jgi:hypothetical protein
MEMMSKGRGSCRDETKGNQGGCRWRTGNVASRRIQNSTKGRRACDPRGRLLSHVAARTNFHQRRGRSAKMPSLPCRPRRVAWTFPGLCRRQFNCLVANLPFSGGLELSLRKTRGKRQRPCLLVALECRQLCVSWCPIRILELIGDPGGDVSSRRWARRGEVAAPAGLGAILESLPPQGSSGTPPLPIAAWVPGSQPCCRWESAWQPAEWKGAREGPMSGAPQPGPSPGSLD